MSFEAGTRVGPYEILSPIGSGGMGAVYRARDTRLDRIVAIKVLTGGLAADPESRRRFEEEARAIAALNDPHICTIHDVGHEGDLDYLVLEYLEGETLGDRIRLAGALPLAEALTIAVQIGDALDRAHRAGIVHRDLKPANVMLVSRAGASEPVVKLLDFGLASRTSHRPRALDASLTATAAPSMVATRPPSATVQAASSGMSGTVQYMSPEQLDGQVPDHRADIFAFGCVLYEMLAGRKAFEAGSAMTAIAAIMSSDPPPIPALAAAHPLIDHILRRCLEKSPDRRWQSIRDVTGELRWVTTQPVPAPATASRRANWGPWHWAGAAILASVVVALPFGLLGALGLLDGSNDEGEQAPLQLEITTPPTDDVGGAIAPDGSQITYVAIKDHVPVLWVRPLDSLESRALPGTEGASFPFWSPDGKSLGFFADNKLKRIEVSGGAPIVITDAPTARGGAWGPDGTILFAPGVNAPIKRVPARGGTVEAVTTIGGKFGSSHRRPNFLPDGQHFLFNTSLGGPDTNGVYIGSLDKSEPVRISTDEDSGFFAPPDTLLTISQGNLRAYRFNPTTRSVAGEPVLVAQGVSSPGLFGATANGVLAYRTGVAQVRQLVWVDRSGNELQNVSGPRPGSIASPELSPDEKSVALFLHPSAGEDNDVWVFELARFLGRPITTGPPADAHPFWDPDGAHLIFNSGRSGARGITRFPLLSGAKPELLAAADDVGANGVALAITRDRQFLLARRPSPATGIDLQAIAVADGRTIPVTELAGDETEGQFSPDGKWVAYVGTISGRPEVYIQSFPDGAARMQISTVGGAQVRWSADGREIFYIAPDGKLMAVTFAAASTTPEVKLPVALFQTHLANGNNVIGNKAQYAVSRDGRFLLNTVVESPSAPIVVSVNWRARLGKQK
jgi:eukaryotic-like serine/threonine-protein kinase